MTFARGYGKKYTLLFAAVKVQGGLWCASKVEQRKRSVMLLSWSDLLDKLKRRVEIQSPSGGTGPLCYPFLLGLLLYTSPDLYSMFLDKMPDLFTSN